MGSGFIGIMHGYYEIKSCTIGSETVMLPHRTYLFPGFLTAERAEHFIELAKARLAPSALAMKKGDTADSTRWGLPQRACMFLLFWVTNL